MELLRVVVEQRVVVEAGVGIQPVVELARATWDNRGEDMEDKGNTTGEGERGPPRMTAAK